jgi:D-alanyl-D-alanine carboxypeptidase
MASAAAMTAAVKGRRNLDSEAIMETTVIASRRALGQGESVPRKSLPPPPPGYDRRMPRHGAARRLAYVGRDGFGRRAYLAPGAARAWTRMAAAAADDGVPLEIVSAFRSLRRQRRLLVEKLREGTAWTEILRYTAYPGHSEHHSGRALDLGMPGRAELTDDFERSAQFRWLKANARLFGFSLSYPRGNARGIGYEPWHWCWKRERP